MFYFFLYFLALHKTALKFCFKFSCPFVADATGSECIVEHIIVYVC